MYQYLEEKKKKLLFNSLMIMVISLGAFLIVKTINTIKDYQYIGRGVYAANVVSVSGKGEVYAVPDIASFSFSVTENAKTAGQAQDLATKKMNSILTSLKAMGIADKDLKTTGYSSYPKYEWSTPTCPQYETNDASAMAVPVYCPPGKQVLTGYEVSQTITVKVRKVDDAGTALTKVGSAGAENISGLSFVVDDLDKVQIEARNKAIADARQKAEDMAKNLGVHLGKITSFYDNSNQYPYGEGMGGGVVMSAKSTPELPAGENKITSQVTITYEIR